MRFLFILLLLANLALFFWGQLRHDAAQTTPSSPDLQPLVLLKERPGFVPPPPEPVAPTPPPAAVVQPPAPVQSAEQDAPAAAPESPEPAPTPPPPPPVPRKPPPPTVPTAPALPKTVQASAAVREWCARIGPFADEKTARTVQGLPAHAATRIETRTGVDKGWWVLRPPLANEEEARAVRRRFLAQGVTDALVLREGTLANAVSLGFFRERAGAEKTLGAARAKGVGPLEIRPQRGGEVYLILRLTASPTEWQGAREILRRKAGARVDETGCGG